MGRAVEHGTASVRVASPRWVRQLFGPAVIRGRTENARSGRRPGVHRATCWESPSAEPTH